MKRLLGQEGELLDRLYERDDLVIYLGPDDSDELLAMTKDLGMQPISFSGRIKIGCKRVYGRASYEWREIPVVVVPWMKGAMIVPRV